MIVYYYAQDHEEYASLFVGSKKQEGKDEDSEGEDSPSPAKAPQYSTNHPQLKDFLSKRPEKVDVNVKSEVGGSIIQLKKKSFYRSIGNMVDFVCFRGNISAASHTAPTHVPLPTWSPYPSAHTPLEPLP